MVFPKKHQSKYCIFQIDTNDSPLTKIVTQARTCAFQQMVVTGQLAPKPTRFRPLAP